MLVLAKLNKTRVESFAITHIMPTHAIRHSRAEQMEATEYERLRCRCKPAGHAMPNTIEDEDADLNDITRS